MHYNNGYRAILIGGKGDDTLIGNGGKDTFVYKYENAGNDLIEDFTVGNTSTNADADMQCDSDAIYGEKVLVIGALLSLASIKTVTINSPVIGVY
jgi:hypothetical protein